MDYAKAVYPHQKYEIQKHMEFIAYCFRMRSELDMAEEEERRGNPFKMLTIPAECRPWGKLEFEIYLKKSKHAGE